MCGTCVAKVREVGVGVDVCSGNMEGRAPLHWCSACWIILEKESRPGRSPWTVFHKEEESDQHPWKKKKTFPRSLFYSETCSHSLGPEAPKTLEIGRTLDLVILFLEI